MASVLNRLLDTKPDRRIAPRSDLRLEITLRRAREGTVIPAVIANLSARGFLADIPERIRLPETLETDLPNGSLRTVQVVRVSGTLASCNFTASLSKSDLSAARLKSNFREQEAAKAAPTFSIGPSDPICDMINEAAPSEILPPRRRILLIVAAGAIPWLTLAGLAALLSA